MSDKIEFESSEEIRAAALELAQSYNEKSDKFYDSLLVQLLVIRMMGEPNNQASEALIDKMAHAAKGFYHLMTAAHEFQKPKH